MKIGGFVKNSFVDYPGNIACVVFVVGCNMRCWYCHNSHLFDVNHKTISEIEIFDFLSSHKGFLDGVVVSGGEPTLQNDLVEFVEKIKKMGYLVKLDTNGTNPEVVKTLIDKKLVDYIAMDIKAPLEKYESITKVKIDTKKIKESIELIMNSKIDYEFRTTFSPDLTVFDIVDIAKLISGAKSFSLQKYNTVQYNKINMLPRKKDDFFEAKKLIEKYVESVVIKGL